MLGVLCEMWQRGGFCSGGAELPCLAAASPQHPGGATPAWGGSPNMRGLHLDPFGMCFSVKHLNYPQRKDNVVRFLAVGVCLHSRCRSSLDTAPPGLGGGGGAGLRLAAGAREADWKINCIA